MKNFLIIGGSNGIGKSLTDLLSVNNKVHASYRHTPIENSRVTSFAYEAMQDINLEILPEVIDGFAYCPGTIQLKPFARFSTTDFEEDYRIQVLGAVKILQTIMPRMKVAESPSVVFFSTVAVQTGFPFHSLVSSSKGALEGLTKALSAELSPKFRVNCIAPSITDTPLASSLLSTDEKKSANAQRHPLKKIGKPEDAASLAEFLLTDKSGWITGQIFHVDGGMSTLRV